MSFINRFFIQRNKTNQIIGKPSFGSDSHIDFKGKNNILFVEPGVKLQNSEIVFYGDNSLIYLSSSLKEYQIKISIYNDSTIFFGHNNYFNGYLTLIVSERQNVLLGNDCLFSFGIWMRTSDVHLIYDVKTGNRTNMSKSIFIGDHVWLGQNSLLLKGSRIGSGSIVAANCVVPGKTVQSNSIYAGNPARKIKSDIYFKSNSAHAYDKLKTTQSMNDDYRGYIYEKKGKIIDIDKLDQRLKKKETASDKLELINNTLVKNKNPNRFYIK